MPIPDKPRIYRMAHLHATTLAADATDLVDEAIQHAKGDPFEAAEYILRRNPTDQPLCETLDKRVTVLLALDVLFAFAPETRQHLIAGELMDEPRPPRDDQH